jgi:hypothetical protein
MIIEELLRGNSGSRLAPQGREQLHLHSEDANDALEVNYMNTACRELNSVSRN